MKFTGVSCFQSTICWKLLVQRNSTWHRYKNFSDKFARKNFSLTITSKTLRIETVDIWSFCHCITKTSRSSIKFIRYFWTLKAWGRPRSFISCWWWLSCPFVYSWNREKSLVFTFGELILGRARRLAFILGSSCRKQLYGLPWLSQ